MRHINRMRPLALGCALLIVATAAWAHENGKAKPMPASTMSSHAGHSAASMEMHKIMMDGQKMPMPMSGNVDKDFATMMTMHHQQAIKMIDVQLKNGKNADLKALARKMQAAQRDEIKKMAPHTK